MSENPDQNHDPKTTAFIKALFLAYPKGLDTSKLTKVPGADLDRLDIYRLYAELADTGHVVRDDTGKLFVYGIKAGDNGDELAHAQVLYDEYLKADNE
jgi:hypothetical protein